MSTDQLTEDGRYAPNDDEWAIIDAVVALRDKPGEFQSAGAAIDGEYNDFALRRRRKRELRAMRLTGEDGRPLGCSDPTKAMPPPRARRENDKGEPEPRKYLLRDCLDMAIRDMVDDETSLSPNVLPDPRRLELARQRLLVGCIFFDPNRGEVERVMALQDLVNVITPDGRPPLTAEPLGDNDLYVAADGSLDRRIGKRFIAKLSEALSVAAAAKGNAPPKKPPAQDEQAVYADGMTPAEIRKELGDKCAQWLRDLCNAAGIDKKDRPSQGKSNFRYSPHTIKLLSVGRQGQGFPDGEEALWESVLKRVGEPGLCFPPRAKQRSKAQ